MNDKHKAFEHGVMDRKYGLTEDENPYMNDHPFYETWRFGWNLANTLINAGVGSVLV